MIRTTLAVALWAGLLSVVRSSPVARDIDGALPISWQDPGGNYFCWTVQGDQPTAGQIIDVEPCNDSPSQSFIYTAGPTSIQVAGTNLCVEFGPGLGRDGTPIRVQTCRRNGAPGQRLYITDDAHVALQNGPGKCVDVTNAARSLQSWQCGSGNTNQSFTFGPPPAPIARTLSPNPDYSRCLRFSPLDPQPGAEDESYLGLADCALLPESQFYFSLGANPELRDVEGNVFWIRPIVQGDGGVISATTTRPAQPPVVEAGAGDYADAVRITSYDESLGDVLFCITLFEGLDPEWYPCDGLEPEQVSAQYFYPDPPL